MRFEVLGPMRVMGTDDARPVTGARQRILLGALLAQANRPVPTGRLADFVWDGEPPQQAVKTLRTYVARLRSDLGPQAAARIITRDGGYLAEVGPEELDTLVFEALARNTGAAIRAGDWARASEHASRAVALWRGIPLADVPSQALHDAWLPRLVQQRIQVTEWRIDAELQLGHHAHLIEQLRQLTADHPLRERFHAQLMLALARCGRQAEALAAYQDARKLLIDELGIEPGPELRRLHERILAGEDNTYPSLSAATAAPRPAEPAVPGPTAPTVPRQLPAAAGNFTGRDGELELIVSLDAAWRKDPGTPADTVLIFAIDGMAGIGKTALAVHAAHRLIGQYPDGQLFLDLHGHTKDYSPRDPGEALAGLLRALGVHPGQIPDEPDERAALYRQRLAGTRTLIVLDNVLKETQVRPLLPGDPGCLVIMTSRRRLKGLHDTRIVALDVLPEADSVTLLRTATTSAQASASDLDLTEIASLCGRLPLALRIAGALLRHRPSWTPGYLAGLLRDEHRRLAALADGDHDLRAVFDLSYNGLDEHHQLLFRRLALVPGPEVDAFAAAALLDTDSDTAAASLQDLVDHNLLIEHAPGRYRLHDLIRVHARTLAYGDPQLERDSTLDRLLHYYAYTAQTASVLIAGNPRVAPDGPPPACTPTLNGSEEAWAWLRDERENLQTAYSHARERALDEHIVALTAGLAEILCREGSLAHAADLHQAAATIAERQCWPADRATALTDLATVRRLAGDLPGAADAATEALPIHRATGNRNGQASALTDLGRVRFLTGDLAGAADAANQVLEIHRATGNRNGQANALTDLSHTRLLTGDLPGAADTATEALQIYRTTGDRHGQANALAQLTRVRFLTGDFAEAADAAEQALKIYRASGDRHGEALVLTELGRVRLAAGNLPGATAALARALEIFRSIGTRNGEAWALNHYAAVIAATGNRPQAFALYQQALAMNRELNKPDDEAIALEGIGDCHLSAGETEAGAAHLGQALEIYERLGMKPDVQRVRSRLERRR